MHGPLVLGRPAGRLKQAELEQVEQGLTLAAGKVGRDLGRVGLALSGGGGSRPNALLVSRSISSLVSSSAFS
jgi:hypothetical protein